MNYRKLRIAWSVGCGVLCALLIALWVRSYWWTDGISWQITDQNSLTLSSGLGILSLHEKYWRNYIPPPGEEAAVTYFSDPRQTADSARWWFGSRQETGDRFTEIPIWFALALVATMATAPWLRFQFSLRTLLIATTLVAVALGVIVAVLRWPAG